MDKREELLELCGQIVNGMMSSDGSFMTKVLDRSLHSGAASATVALAIKIQEKIDEHFNEK